ncbi:MAG: hypothetical protein GXP51_08965 [Deltaproteobacteria bacterium]|nr:hypothetical protein [Deltaproteobacteria bacterium]
MLRLLNALLLMFLLTACSSVVISPQPRPGSQIDATGRQVSRTTHGVKLTVKIYDVSVRPSPVEQNYCSFWVTVTNLRDVLLPLKISDFQLIDDQGRQYPAADPDKLSELLTINEPYLIPYPYVGFYYLQDSVLAGADNQFKSESSFYSFRRPESLKLDALPETEVLPAATVAGAIYFPAELRTMRSFSLRYQTGALPGQKSFQISLPFTVEKK